MDLAAVIDKLAGVPADKLAPIVNDVLRSQRNLKFVPNPGPQTDAWFSPADLLLYGGQAGGGKAQPMVEQVLTPHGWRAMGDLKVGSKVIGIDGRPTRVIAVHPQGVKDVYRVDMVDGGSCLACGEHLWVSWDTSRNVRKQAATPQKFTTLGLMERVNAPQRSDGRNVTMMLPPMGAVQFSVAGRLQGRGNFVGRRIDPYLLGLLLGDGCVTSRQPTITSMDDEIVEYVVDLVGDENVVVVDHRPVKNLVFRSDFRKALISDLEALGLLGCDSSSKHIPYQYKWAPVPDRMALLQGLMDTDGWAEKKRACYYGTISEQLRDDVIDLCRSLGMLAKHTSKIPTYTYQGETRTGQRFYPIRIKAPDPEGLFRLSRKIEVARTIQFQSLGRAIKSIEPAGQAECQCITVEDPASMYVTRDFIPTHNSGLLCGLALQQHTNSLLVRRQGTALEGGGGLIGDLLRLHGSRNGYSGKSPPTLRTEDGRTITFGSAPNLGDEERYQGRPRDLFGADEATQFLEQQIDFFMGWVRTISPGQRTRSVLASNPPLSAEGDWVIRKFRPWLDLTHPDPAEPGELRWFIRDEKGEEAEVRDGTPVERGGHTYHPTSRTFIPASLADNPFIVTSQYQKQLDALPGFYRDAIRDGNFMASRVDHPEQAIPTAWIQAAMDRWQPDPPDNVPMTCIAVDPAQGGGDRTALAMRYGHWTDKVVTVPGADTPTGRETMALVLQHRKHLADIIVDCGGGYGGETVSRLSDNGLEAYPYKGADRSTRWSEDQAWRYANLRAETVWALREALDPGQSGGSVVQLPPDQDLLSELAAYRFTADRTVAGQQGLLMESKDKMKKRLGRSPDKADAVLMAWWYGPHSLTHGRVWDQASQVVRSGDRPVRVISGRRKRR